MHRDKQKRKELQGEQPISSMDMDNGRTNVKFENTHVPEGRYNNERQKRKENNNEEVFLGTMRL
jgi:hypothetical protein